MAILAKINSFSFKKEFFKISDYLDSRLITFLDVGSRDEAIYSLINLLEKEVGLIDKAAFSRAIFHREELVSTGIGMGVAIPHAKVGEFSDFFIVLGIQQKTGIDWNALDKGPVRLVFLIGGPENQQTEYLQILSLLTSAIRDAELRKKLLSSQTKEQVLELFSSF